MLCHSHEPGGGGTYKQDFTVFGNGTCRNIATWVVGVVLHGFYELFRSQ